MSPQPAPAPTRQGRPETPRTGPETVVLDLEGTLSALGALRGALFTYTCEHLAVWLREDSPCAQQVRADTARLTGRDTLSADAALHVLRGWLGRELEAANPLRTARDRICQDGFRAGEIAGVFYPDVRPALESWKSSGWSVHTYSLSPAPHQRAWFEHAEGGSMAHLVDGWFDLESAGPKDDPDSYRRLTRVLDAPSDRTLLVSDSTVELAAADRAGWATVLITRPDSPSARRDDGIPCLLEIDLERASTIKKDAAQEAHQEV